MHLDEITPAMLEAETTACLRQFSRAPHQAELGQLEWLRRRSRRQSLADAPWEAIVPGLYRWAEEGRKELVETALSDLPTEDQWRLDRFLLQRMVTETGNASADPASKTRLLLVTNIAVVNNESAMLRQEAALQRTEKVARHDGAVCLLNAFVTEEARPREGWIHRLLPRSARNVMSSPVPPIPIVKDVMDAACAEARKAGISHFGFFNSDVLLTPTLLDLVREAIRLGHNCQAYVRTDVPSADRIDAAEWIEIHLSGADAFFVSTEWWESHRVLMEDYLLGTYWWDCVWVGQMMMHGNFFYASHLRGLLFHPVHPRLLATTPRVTYNLRIRQQFDEAYYEVQTRYSDRLRDHISRNRSLPCIATNRTLFDNEVGRLAKIIRFLRQ